MGHHGDGKLNVCTGGLLANMNQGFGFVNKYKDMVGLRVVLGIFESGIYPGIAYLLSTWYTRCKWIHHYLSNSMIDSIRRRRQAILRFLYHWLHRERFWRNPGLWTHANGRAGWESWLALDLHHGRPGKLFLYSPIDDMKANGRLMKDHDCCGSHCLHGDGRLSGPGRSVLEISHCRPA